jgi:hypothetical protein
MGIAFSYPIGLFGLDAFGGLDEGGSMELLIVATILGLIPAAIARSKGRDFVGWWMYGAALFIVALPHALLYIRDLHSRDRHAARATA